MRQEVAIFFYILIALEKWKQQSGRFLANWFNVLGELEALATLAQIRFDYRLRPGPSTTRNALYLMELAGIGVEE